MQRLKRQRGFTLIELLIVMSIIGILAAISVPSYKQSTVKARETVLMEDLYQMRHAIDAFFADHNRYPESLDELVTSKYLRGVPRDPFTGAGDSWEVLPPEPTDDGELAEGGIYDVKSGSDKVGLNGIPYSDW
ncbi:general secretion pathway protein GspG [Geothermobacter hydrogeniphilus]|uniref:General secretion pathway protein GspG n=1 Tax=Geothermobacter hydrogeniphilus TaxID=1969733 RepID=A0A2K2HC58_9BACT|nr:type II secretion system protein [Geothermobacter hydrogeniphilus]PNU20809.1 general secretion pathway protein GspG [Geothermobacter hydrogeniphilus]